MNITLKMYGVIQPCKGFLFLQNLNLYFTDPLLALLRTLYITVPSRCALFTGGDIMETGQVTEGSYRTLCLLSRTSRTVGSHWTGVASGSVCWGGGVSTTGTHIASTARSSRFHQAYKMKKKSLLLVCKRHSLIKTFIRTFLYRNKLQMLFKHFFF